ARSLGCATNHGATSAIYTLSLHDALPISGDLHALLHAARQLARVFLVVRAEVDGLERPVRALEPLGLAHTLDLEPEGDVVFDGRSEEHTSELQSRENLVCRLLLEKDNLDA